MDAIQKDIESVTYSAKQFCDGISLQEVTLEETTELQQIAILSFDRDIDALQTPITDIHLVEKEVAVEDINTDEQLNTLFEMQQRDQSVAVDMTLTVEDNTIDINTLQPLSETTVSDPSNRYFIHQSDETTVSIFRKKYVADIIIDDMFNMKHRFKKTFSTDAERDTFIETIRQHDGYIELTENDTYQIQLESLPSMAETNQSYLDATSIYPFIAFAGVILYTVSSNIFLSASIILPALLYFIFTNIASRIHAHAGAGRDETIPIRKKTNTYTIVEDYVDTTAEVQEVVLNRTKTEDSIIFKAQTDTDITWTVDVRDSNWRLQELYTIIGFENVHKEYIRGYITNSDAVNNNRAIESDCGNWELTEL